MRKTCLVFLVLCPLFSAGCAFTVDKVVLDYRFEQSPNASWADVNDCTLGFGEFCDSRSVADPNILLHKKNTYGWTCSGGYKAERPLAEMVRDGLEAGFERAGMAVVTENPTYIMDGDVQTLDYTVIVGFWDGDVEPSLTARLALRDAGNGRIIWKDTVVAKSRFKTAWQDDVVKKGVPMTLDAMVQAVLADEYLRQRLVEARKEAR